MILVPSLLKKVCHFTPSASVFVNAYALSYFLLVDWGPLFFSSVNFFVPVFNIFYLSITRLTFSFQKVLPVACALTADGDQIFYRT